MSKIKIFFIAAASILLLGIIGYFSYMRIFPAKVVHYHAGFVVFENNKKLDFSDSKYMYIKPCTVNGSEVKGSKNVQMEKAHLHDNVGDLVHIEANGATWQDLFTNIKFPMDYAHATGYLNNQKVVDFQKLPIHPDDSLVVFIGDNDEKYLAQGVTKAYIESESKKSTGCSD